jgi:coenzyme F420-reducing hydrogenase beta subunit
MKSTTKVVYNIVPVENCTGCSACRDQCPQQAVEMREDREGFLFPAVDESKCNQCGCCVKICPVKTVVPVETIDEPTVYAAWTRDRELLRESTSGGAFSEIARVILDRGGVVFGAAYDEHMIVRHIAVESWDGLCRLRGSKYVQSDVGDSYQLARDYLDAGRAVLYSGTPCQVAGMYAAIGKDYANLLTCDLICHGGAVTKGLPHVSRLAEKTLSLESDRFRVSCEVQRMASSHSANRTGEWKDSQ